MTGSVCIKVFDFFTGCGGTCVGFRKAGLDVVFALDNDADCKRTFKSNFNWVPYQLRDITSSRTTKLKPLLEKYASHPKLYAHWVAENPTLPNVEEICVRWEGKRESDLEDNGSTGGTLNEVEEINEDRSYEDEEVPF